MSAYAIFNRSDSVLVVAFRKGELWSTAQAQRLYPVSPLTWPSRAAAEAWARNRWGDVDKWLVRPIGKDGAP